MEHENEFFNIEVINFIIQHEGKAVLNTGKNIFLREASMNRSLKS